MICSSEKGEVGNSFLFSLSWGLVFALEKEEEAQSLFRKSKITSFLYLRENDEKWTVPPPSFPPFLNFPAASFPFSFSPRRRDGRPNSPSFYFFFLKTFHASPQFRNARSRNALKSPLIFPFLMIKILVRVHKITH